MKKFTCYLFFSFCVFIIKSQTATDAPLPDKFDGLKEALLVNHFPSPVYATTDTDENAAYLWKHTTSVLSPTHDITITEIGAYIFYNNQWNLRVSMTQKDFDKLFDAKKGLMKKGQPYTFKDNWRHDNRLLGGWAMWYFIGANESGEKIYGVGKLNTIGELFNNQN